MKKAYKAFVKQRQIVDELDAIDPEIIERVFGVTGKLEKEQFMVLASIVKSDTWMDNPILFENMILSINGISPSVYEYEGCNVNYLWYGLFLMKKYRPDLALGELVKGYIEFIHSEDGFYIFPKEAGMSPLVTDFLTEILEKFDTVGVFNEFKFTDNQASKLTDAVNYIQIKIKEDEII